jgi:hypothetical protein
VICALQSASVSQPEFIIGEAKLGPLPPLAPDELGVGSFPSLPFPASPLVGLLLEPSVVFGFKISLLLGAWPALPSLPGGITGLPISLVLSLFFSSVCESLELGEFSNGKLGPLTLFVEAWPLPL